MEHPRLFLAIPVAEPARSELRRACAEYLNGQAKSLRGVPVSNWHVTIKFLGATPDAVAGALAHEVEDVLRPIRAPLRSTRIAPFPTRRPVVLALHCRAHSGLRALASRLDELAAQHGLPRETRPHSPHVTLARGGRRILDDLPQSPCELELLPEDLCLYESRSGPGGVRYLPLRHWQLCH